MVSNRPTDQEKKQLIDDSRLFEKEANEGGVEIASLSRTFLSTRGALFFSSLFLFGQLAACESVASIAGDEKGGIGTNIVDNQEDELDLENSSETSLDISLTDQSDADDSEEEDPCLSDKPPAYCELEYEPTGPGCGDGEINQPSEECDDGNGLPGDGCSGICSIEPNFVCDEAGCRSTIVCGDGITSESEVCDDGNKEDGDGCAADCYAIEPGFECLAVEGQENVYSCSEINPCTQPFPPASCFPPPGETPYCGDGEKFGTEACDDGNYLPGDGCNGACQVENNWDCSGTTCVPTIVCGDGHVEGGEVCDDNNQIPNDGCESDCFSLTVGFTCPAEGGACSEVDPCTQPNPPQSCTGGGGPPPTPKYCGDNEINVTGEVCDDGNTLPGDGCNGACKVENNWDCSSGTCVFTIVCGDGVREGAEVCDDNNEQSNDGCSSDCLTVEDNYSCPLAGGACTSTVSCNDGRITGEEECEDGNSIPNDGCSSECIVETGYYCPEIGEPCEPIPYCGDGSQSAAEECDDGGASQPGCSAECLVEEGYACPTPGQVCQSIEAECGDGELSSDEECDDGNEEAEDGCSATCTIETGFVCPNENQPCIAKCGDGTLVGTEICDDGNTDDGDGCSSVCVWEPGYNCEDEPPHFCSVGSCGDGFLGTDEACDDGNVIPGDGCGANCTAEPTCVYGSTGCSSICGDGLIIDEACDDGNNRDGDGCSSDCEVEDGYYCSQEEKCSDFLLWDHDSNDTTPGIITCVSRIPIIYRDFKKSHPHFEPGWNSSGTKGLVENELDANGKPVWSGVNDGLIGSTPERFTDWFNESPSWNHQIVDEIVLWDKNRDPLSGSYDPNAVDVTFVNRYGDQGEPFLVGASPGNPGTPAWTWCGNKWNTEGTNPQGICSSNGGYNTATCRATHPSHIRCVATSSGQPNGTNEVAFGSANVNTWYAEYLNGYQAPDPGVPYDGNPTFFPIDGQSFSTGDFLGADVPAFYGGGGDPQGGDHNFHFTSEVRRWFEYKSGRSYQLEFSGDDDVWVFINGKLVIDLGGWHEVQQGSLGIDVNGVVTTSPVGGVNPTSVADLDMIDGNVYEIVVFHAERKYTASSYRLTLAGFNANPSECASECGDGIVASDEQCDDAADNAGLTCTSCELESYCGDGDVDAGEECDNGTNLSGYNDSSSNACAPGCRTPSSCGDGEIDFVFGEICDEGAANSDTAYDGCTTVCTLGPTCGDGDPTDGEECDDGVNDGQAGCGPDCRFTASCGNGVLDSPELCDDGLNDNSYNGCSSSCGFGPYCGDRNVDENDGETCDDGVNNGQYGGCSALCLAGPRCGDGIVDRNYEECDDAQNDGGYGECGPGCTAGPRCGDGEIDYPFEECDDEVNDGTVSLCEEGCVLGPHCGDGELDEGEECDDGVNNGGYGECAPGCVFGPRCGDGQIQEAYEECDDQSNSGGYGQCAANCQLGPYCGDGQRTDDETCDDGVNNGDYGRCAPGCQAGAYCGDGIKDPEEECDDGTNDGQVTSCQPGCVLGPGCGDGIIQQEAPYNEECDDGVNNGGYGECAPGCVFGPRCGDGQVQEIYEECDDEVNDGSYGTCAANCQFAPYCGDGQLNGEETCDDEINNGEYGRCAQGCRTGAYCGDRIVDLEEECDDGVNDGLTTSCQPGCVKGPGCGDGIIQPDAPHNEECDHGSDNRSGYAGCDPVSCTLGPYCGDGVVQAPYEQCDDQENTGGYGRCASNCRVGPHCGDGVVNGSEVCDDGVNDGGYGQCAPGCKLGPYCGDGKKNGEEGCDDGNRKSLDGCSASCEVEDFVVR
ncbi:MAG: DUF4215 domain-containing protein [Polyangiaceae bacterium]|nr:DUF4215 domain-containing protein [Polyangiaceae bacterium]